MVKIRLARMGSKNKPKYRIVAADEKFKRDGRFLEILGHYDPTTNPFSLVVKKDKIDWWVSRGAQVSETVSKLVFK